MHIGVCDSSDEHRCRHHRHIRVSATVKQLVGWLVGEQEYREEQVLV